MKKILHAQKIKGVVREISLSEPKIFRNNEKLCRSGHVGHGLAEFEDGKIIDFYANNSPLRFDGHSGYGWWEYKISEDHGKTFGEGRKFPYSWESFLNGCHNAFVEKVVSKKDGRIIAFCTTGSLTSQICCEPYYEPKSVISEDGGKTWSEPYTVSPYRGRIFDAKYHDGKIYVLQFCNDAEESFYGNKPEHKYRIFTSNDEKTFIEESEVAFPDTVGRAYGNMVFTANGELIVYAYNVNDEKNMDYAISKDGGKTWAETGNSYVAKNIRNPQVGILDGQYILHGRSGENERGAGGFVLYTSADGIKWDEGTMLIEGKSACFYSNNLTIKSPDGKERMLVQYSENIKDPFTGWSGRVNVMHLWIESI